MFSQFLRHALPAFPAFLIVTFSNVAFADTPPRYTTSPLSTREYVVAEAENRAQIILKGRKYFFQQPDGGRKELPAGALSGQFSEILISGDGYAARIQNDAIPLPGTDHCAVQRVDIEAGTAASLPVPAYQPFSFSNYQVCPAMSVALGEGGWLAVADSRARMVRFFSPEGTELDQDFPENLDAAGCAKTLSHDHIFACQLVQATATTERVRVFLFSPSDATVEVPFETATSFTETDLQLSPGLNLLATKAGAADSIQTYNLGTSEYKKITVNQPRILSAIYSATPQFDGSFIGSGRARFENSDHMLHISPEGVVRDISCSIPNRSGMLGGYYGIAGDGSFVGSFTARNHSETQTLLVEPTDASSSSQNPKSAIWNTSANYCTQISVRALGACSRYFADDGVGGLYQNKFFPGDLPKQCTFRIHLRDSVGRALKGKQVVLRDSVSAIRTVGKTDRKGRALLTTVIEGSAHYNFGWEFRFWNDKTLRSSAVGFAPCFYDADGPSCTLR